MAKKLTDEGLEEIRGFAEGGAIGGEEARDLFATIDADRVERDADRERIKALEKAAISERKMSGGRPAKVCLLNYGCRTGFDGAPPRHKPKCVLALKEGE